MPSSPLDRSKAYESNGLILDDGAYLSSGSAVPTHSANYGDWYFRDGTFEVYTHNGTIWVLRTFGEGGGANDIVMSFTRQDQPYLWTTNTNYTLLGEFIFPGTARIGSPGNIEIIVGSNHAENDVDFRIYDRTNSLQIAELTGVIGLDRVALDVGTLTNLPSAESVFEIQAKRVGASSKAEFSSIRLKF